MTQAINSTRGRAIEAMFSHVLRACRLADKETGSHTPVWAKFQDVFDKELANCVDGNFEFSTLAGAYSGNLEYIDREWLKTNIGKIFPVDRPTNLSCALGGLAYASVSRRSYRMLRDAGVLDAALRLDLKGRHSREKLMERIAVGYLWGEDALDSSRFKFIFDSDRAEDLEQINFFFWTIRGEKLEDEQLKRIMAYWKRCLEWAATQSTPPAKVLSSLSGLAAFLPTAAGENAELLAAVAPYVNIHHGVYDFLKELQRLAETNAAEVIIVLRKFVETHEPFYDYEDRMRTLVSRLPCRGDRQYQQQRESKDPLHLRHLSGCLRRRNPAVPNDAHVWRKRIARVAPLRPCEESRL